MNCHFKFIAMRVICINDNFDNPDKIPTPKLMDIDSVIYDGPCGCGCGEIVYAFERFGIYAGFPQTHFSPFEQEEEEEMDAVHADKEPVYSLFLDGKKISGIVSITFNPRTK